MMVYSHAVNYKYMVCFFIFEINYLQSKVLYCAVYASVRSMARLLTKSKLYYFVLLAR